MTVYALDDIDDAIEATRQFLWPFDLGQWSRLALVMIFVGGAGGFNPFQFGGGSPGGNVPDGVGAPGVPDGIPAFGGPELAIIVGAIAVIATIGLLFKFIGSIMEFVFVSSLQNESVTVRRYWSAHWGAGVRLFVFRLLFGVLTFSLFGLLVVVALAPVIFGDGSFSAGLLVLTILGGISVLIVSGLIGGFTTVFVVPIMLLEECGLISAWRRFWPTLTGQWKQYAAYAVMGFILQLAAGIAASLVTVLGAIVIAIPFGILGVLGFGLISVSQVAGWAVIAIATILFVLAVIVLSLAVSVPVQTFLRYYALLVLGDTDERFDLIPDQRLAIRD